MNSIDEKTALIELTDAELYEVAGGNFVFTINNQESNQGVQVSGIQGVQVSGIFGHRAFKTLTFDKSLPVYVGEGAISLVVSQREGRFDPLFDWPGKHSIARGDTASGRTQ